MNMCSLLRATKSKLTVAWQQYDSCGTQGYVICTLPHFFCFYSCSFYLRPSFAKLITNQPTTNPIASLICEIKLNYRPTHSPTHTYFVLGCVYIWCMWCYIFVTVRDMSRIWSRLWDWHFGEKIRARPLCTENSVERTQSYVRNPVWPKIRDS